MSRQHLSYALSMMIVVTGLVFAGSAAAQDQTPPPPPPMEQPDDATPPDPQDVADKFIENTKKLGDVVVAKNAEVAQKTVEYIEQLLEQDRQRAARHVAREAIERIKRVGKTSTGRIRYHARRTLGVLNKLEAEESVIQSVKDEARKQQRRIHRSCGEAMKEIGMAVGDLHVEQPRPDEVE